MTLKPADLPLHLRKLILAEAQRSLGAETYRELFNSIGEDGVIAMMGSQLSPALRTIILGQAFLIIGAQEYPKLVESVGEDGVLEMFLTPPPPVVSPARSLPAAQPRRFGWLRNINWAGYGTFAAAMAVSGLLTHIHGDDFWLGVGSSIPVLFIAWWTIRAASYRKLSAAIAGYLGLSLAALSAVTGVVLALWPGFGWWYLLLWLTIGLGLLTAGGYLLAGAALQCEECGSKNTEIVEQRVGAPTAAYADKAKAVYRRCNNCGHTQFPWT